MNEKQAIALVQETFGAGFERQRYIHFLKNLLNEFDDEGARSNQGARIPEKFQNYVEKLERVGKYLVDDHEIMLFIVYLKNNTSIERARTMQRNFVAWYLQDGMKDAALVAFVSKDSEDWRFSFIKMEYRYDEQENKIKEEFTPAKRWSFLVGANETSHTAQRKLVPIMADDDHNPTLAELEEAFNVEKVTKEFFEKYRDLFIRAKGELDKAVKANPKTKTDFESKGIDTTNLAKKLLGQIIFLFFLQKKGWFGVPRDAAWGEGSRDFLQELFEKKHATYENFFNDILEPLFYDALRRDRSEDDHYYPNFKCKIPFLNGGLFDPMGGYDWVKTDILLSNELFHNKTKTKEGDVGDGILDIFDRYNFTVKEDEPFEKEVAIDPELLGKAYEKFNAIRPDNFDEFRKVLNSGKKGEESKFNKQYGVFYTPREIVHHMCQQSLINYLATELNVTPAFAPGASVASPEGAKQSPADEEIASGREEYAEQERPRTSSPQGNDMPTRDDIAMLILQGESLLEHEARAESNPSKTYQPILSEAIRRYAALIDEKLANIKVCDPAVGSGAFLVGMMSEIVRAREVLRTWTKSTQTTYDFKRHCIEHSLYGVDIDAGAVEIAKLRLWLSLVVDEDDIQNIKPLPNLDYKIVQGNSLIGVEKNLFNVHLFTELESLKPLYFNATNPNQKKETKKKIDGLIEQITDGHSQFDFEIYFSEVFHEKGGFDVVIGNPPYGAKMLKSEEKIFITKYPIVKNFPDTYCCFIAKSIDLIKPSGKLALIVPNTFCDLESCDDFRKWLLTKNELLEIYQTGWAFEQAVVDTIAFFVNKEAGKDNYQVIVKTEEKQYSRDVEGFLKNNLHKIDYRNNANILAFLNKINNFPHLSSFAEVKAGVKLYEKGKGIPPQTDKIMEVRPYTSQKHKNGWLPLYRGDNILRYGIRNAEEFVHYGSWLAAPRSPELFKSPKILMRRTDDKLMSCLETKNSICVNSCHVIKLNEDGIKRLTYSYLLGLLNSKLLQRVFELQNPQMVGKVFAEIKVVYVENLPIRNIDFSNHAERTKYDKMIAIVERILAAKGGNPQADTSALEREIDELVYQLYGLTDEEKDIVEGK